MVRELEYTKKKMSTFKAVFYLKNVLLYYSLLLYIQPYYSWYHELIIRLILHFLPKLIQWPYTQRINIYLCSNWSFHSFLDLSSVKEISYGGRERDRDPDLASALKRFGLEKYTNLECCLTLVYGTNLSDNRVLFLLLPPRLCRLVALFTPTFT